MNSPLKAPIQHFFTASHQQDPHQLQQCFLPDALVLDEGGSYSGHAAIANWFVATRQHYQFSLTPLHSSSLQQEEVVVAEVSGNFPGSPIQLSYSFLLQHDKIQQLKIS